VKFLLFILLLVGTAAHAQIGSITELSGSAVIKRGKDSLTASKGISIEQNDKIETKNGKVKIVFKDDTTVNVTEHSSLVIDDFVYDPKSGKGSLGMKATGGTVRYVSGAIAKDPKQVKINTPTAAIAVRGTDFVMSVNEVGSSMVILMPSCDWETSAVKGVSCASGRIDVESGPNLVTMDRPYQATLVETAGAPPTPPVTVNLFGSVIGNNLQIAPPRTLSGVNVVLAARAAAVASGVIKENKKDNRDEKDEKNDERDHEKQHASKQAEEKRRSLEDDGERKSTNLLSEAEEKTLAGQAGLVTETENPYLFKLWKDKSETQQIGWLYESLSPNGRNYANVVQPMGTHIQIVVTQDMQTNAFNFSSGKPQGQIVINQNYR